MAHGLWQVLLRRHYRNQGQWCYKSLPVHFWVQHGHWDMHILWNNHFRLSQSSLSLCAHCMWEHKAVLQLWTHFAECATWCLIFFPIIQKQCNQWHNLEFNIEIAYSSVLVVVQIKKKVNWFAGLCPCSRVRVWIQSNLVFFQFKVIFVTLPPDKWF